MALLLALLTIILLALCYGVDKLYNDGYLDKKQYRFYLLILAIGLLFICGQMNAITNTNY